MTVGDLLKILSSVPDSFGVTIETDNETKIIKSVSIDHGRLSLRDHVLSIERVVDTFTAHDGSEYTLTVSQTVKYPTVLTMPNPLNRQLHNSVRKLDGNDVA